MPSVSKQQQKFFGLVRALQKGDVSPSSVTKKARDAAKDMKKSDVKKYAATKHKGLPRKVKGETKVRELIKKMVREILDVYLGINKETDKDSYIYKRIDLSGFLVGTIFRDLYFRFKNNVEHTINQEYARLQEYQTQVHQGYGRTYKNIEFYFEIEQSL